IIPKENHKLSNYSMRTDPSSARLPRTLHPTNPTSSNSYVTNPSKTFPRHIRPTLSPTEKKKINNGKKRSPNTEIIPPIYATMTPTTPKYAALLSLSLRRRRRPTPTQPPRNLQETLKHAPRLPPSPLPPSLQSLASINHHAKKPSKISPHIQPFPPSIK
ncbi:hypothetical protein COCMIDRAFT_81730, partial [Bipolaris oryzae ATCC 44560]